MPTREKRLVHDKAKRAAAQAMVQVRAAERQKVRQEQNLKYAEVRLKQLQHLHEQQLKTAQSANAILEEVKARAALTAAEAAAIV